MTTTHAETSGTRELLDKVAAIRRAEAEAAHAAYPQYLGHWTDWTLVEITEHVRTKSGIAFEPGDLVLANPKRWDSMFVTCYSYRNGVDTSVPSSFVRAIRVIEEG
ncbi:hypothetical protein [Pseudonocardia sp. T1-2H]|uniref:hypothetical protein n=1 Tax=Pseudonocardia sp. T1-2H TaxID=3128899 RepID=UPI003101A149